MYVGRLQYNFQGEASWLQYKYTGIIQNGAHTVSWIVLAKGNRLDWIGTAWVPAMSVDKYCTVDDE